MAALAGTWVFAAADLGAVHGLGGAAALGALIGAALTGIWYLTDHPRKPLRNPLDGIGRLIIAVCGSVLFILAAVPAGFAWLGIGPLPLTAPAGVILTFVTVGACFYSFGAGLRMLSAWLVMPAAVLALAAAAGTARRPWEAELVLLVILLAAAWQLPPRIRYGLEFCDDRVRLSRLGFPLMLPDIPGYQVGHAFASGGRLHITVVRQGTPPDQWTSFDHCAFHIDIGIASDEYMQATLETAMADWRRAGPGRWAIADIRGRSRALALHDEVIVEAGISYPVEEDPVPLAALLRATTDLHPVSPGTVMSIWRKANRIQPIFRRRR